MRSGVHDDPGNPGQAASYGEVSDVVLFATPPSHQRRVLLIDIACLITTTTTSQLDKLAYQLNSVLIAQLKRYVFDDSLDIALFLSDEYERCYTAEADNTTLDDLIKMIREAFNFQDCFRLPPSTANVFVETIANQLQRDKAQLSFICEDPKLVEDITKLELTALRPVYCYGMIDSVDQEEFNELVWEKYILGIDIDDTLLNLPESVRQQRVIFNDAVVSYIQEQVTAGKVTSACLVTARYDNSHTLKLLQELATEFPDSDRVAAAKEFENQLSSLVDRLSVDVVHKELQRQFPGLALLPACHSNSATREGDVVCQVDRINKNNVLYKLYLEHKLPVLLLDNSVSEVNAVKDLGFQLGNIAAIRVHDQVSLDFGTQVGPLQNALKPSEIVTAGMIP